MPIGLLGKKIGMTRVFDEDGVVQPVTAIEAGPCPVVAVRDRQEDGYCAVQLAFEPVATKRLTKPQRGVFQAAGLDPHRHLAEFRIEDLETPPEAGAVWDVGSFEPGDRIHVRGTTKGRGFAGVMKRHNFGGGRDSHGSNFHRAPGSVGTATTPGRTLKGQKLPGRYGGVARTVRNLRIVAVDAERNLLLVRGGLPGARGSLLRILKA